MNWRCDVYVYADVSGGWTTHVASRKRILPPIPDLPLPQFKLGEWNGELKKMVYKSIWHRAAATIVYGFWAFWNNYVHMWTLHLIPLRPIGLPHDGKTFNDDSPGECAKRLLWLRSSGYIVPDDAIANLMEEQGADR